MYGILFEEPNPTGSRPSDLIGLYKQQATQRRQRATRRRKKREGPKTGPNGAKVTVPEDQLSGGAARHSAAESEGDRRPECPG